MSKQVFELSYPFEYKGATQNKLEARAPKVRDLRNFLKNVERDSTTAMEKAIADLTETDEKIIAELDLRDFAPIKKWFEDFLKPMLSGSDEF